jgi:hypothetical protein
LPKQAKRDRFDHQPIAFIAAVEMVAAVEAGARILL